MRVCIGVIVAWVVLRGGTGVSAQTPDVSGPPPVSVPEAGPDAAPATGPATDPGGDGDGAATVLGEPAATVEGPAAGDFVLLLVLGALTAGAVVLIRRFGLLKRRAGADARYDALQRAMMPAKPGMPPRNLGLLLVLGSMALWLAAGMIGSIPVALATTPGEPPPATVGMTAASLGAMVGGTVLLLAAAWALWPWMGGGLGLPRSLGEFGRDVKLGAIGLVLTLPPVLLLAAGVGIAMKWLASAGAIDPPNELAHETLRQLAVADKDGAWWSVIALVVIGVPLAEELIYRGLMQTGLRTGLGVGPTRRAPSLDWIAVAMTGAIFSIVHIGTADTHSLVILFALALAMGVAYERTGRLMVPIVMHAGFNGVNIVIAQLGT